MDCIRAALIFSLICLTLNYASAQERPMMEVTTIFYDATTARPVVMQPAAAAVETTTMSAPRNARPAPVEPMPMAMPTESSVPAGGSGTGNSANTGSQPVGQATRSTAAPAIAVDNSGPAQENNGRTATRSTAAPAIAVDNSGPEQENNGRAESGGSSSMDQSESISKRIEDFLSFLIELPVHVPEDMYYEAMSAVSYVGNATNTTSINAVGRRIADFIKSVVELPITIPEDVFDEGEDAVSSLGSETNTTSLDALGRRLRGLFKSLVDIESYLKIGGDIAETPALLGRDIFDLATNLALLPVKLPVELPVLIPRYIYDVVTYVLETPLRLPGDVFDGITDLTKLPLSLSPGTYKEIESIISSIFSNLTSIADIGEGTTQSP